MKKIRDAQTIIGMLEGGELAQQLSGDITETLSKLKDLSDTMGRKAKVKGKVTLTLDFEVEAGSVNVQAGIDTKVPKAAPRLVLLLDHRRRLAVDRASPANRHVQRPPRADRRSPVTAPVQTRTRRNHSRG